MRNTSHKLGAVLLAGTLALSACSSVGTPDVSVPDEIEQDAQVLAAEVEAELGTVATEIQRSEAAADLQGVWDDTRAEVSAAIASFQADGTISTEGLTQQLDEFQSALDGAGDAVAPELRQAWDSLRSTIERMMS